MDIRKTVKIKKNWGGKKRKQLLVDKVYKETINTIKANTKKSHIQLSKTRF